MTDQPRTIFINLPVTNLDRSVRFYEAIGGRKEPKFSDKQAAMMVLTDTISVMLLRHELYSTFTSKPIGDAHRSSGVLLCISCSTRDEVDELVEAAVAAGGKADPGPRQDMKGLMYGRSFEDPDGHHWEPMWMNAQAAEQGAAVFQDVSQGS